MNRASAILGIVGIILLLIVGTARADMIADSTHPVQFIFSGYNLNYSSNLSNSIETTTSTYLNLSINSSYAWFNMTVAGDLNLSQLTYTSDIWNFTGNAIAGTMRVTAHVGNASGNYDLKVDSTVTSTQGAISGIVSFTYAGWSSHAFIIQENTTQAAEPAITYIPPAPIWDYNFTGEYFVNQSWLAGAGNVTDSYNVSVNGTWTNGSAVLFRNTTLNPLGWSNITVWAWNNTGSLSLTNITNNSQAPYTPPKANITSWGNDLTYNDTLTLSVPKFSNISFNATANQTLTTCTWIGATVTNCTANTYAFKNFTTSGIQTVSIQGSNADGSTQTITWTITVAGGGAVLNLSGYVNNSLGAPLINARIDLNSTTYNLTNSTGQYFFAYVSEGDYNTLARQIGYRNSTNTSYLDTDVLMNFTLREKTAAQITPGFNIWILLISIAMVYLMKKRT